MSKSFNSEIQRQMDKRKANAAGEDREGKAKLRLTLEDQIQEFISKGGEIEQVPSTFVQDRVEFNHSIVR